MKLKKALCLILTLAAILSVMAFPAAYAEEYTNTWAGASADNCPGCKFGNKPVLKSASQVDCFMMQFLKSGKTHTKFIVDFPLDLSPAVFNERYGLPSVSVQVKQKNGLQGVKLSIVNFPGNRIASAAKRNAIGSLSADEKEAFRQAKELLDNCVTADMSALEIEQAIIHALINRITYYTMDRTTTTDTSLMRYQTCVGALVDGTANCMGYTDAFNLLASMAGLEVSRQTGFCNGGAHIWSTIRLANGWYAVDLTNIDRDWAGEDDGNLTYMNMTLSQLYALGYTWQDYAMAHTLVG